MSSLHYQDLKQTGSTLREFSGYYSELMKQTTDSSHNYRCHKIDANYDDFSEQTIRPLNATIFFYFFSANRSGKTWAQWMLSSVRYPNDRMRRAYMRFFAWSVHILLTTLNRDLILLFKYIATYYEYQSFMGFWGVGTLELTSGIFP